MTCFFRSYLKILFVFDRYLQYFPGIELIKIIRGRHSCELSEITQGSAAGTKTDKKESLLEICGLSGLDLQYEIIYS